ncbi:MAG TPA: ShlB/FhaC/HecB family hemolysin secretion/activation protein [Novimethylophilus sp.]|uniref:ShlB/FhaC/HecB family hemolysin secretion/activation protein n=1 Tax=Novimethylophilus sp. TaxID=2137426 RepID=UPI002F3FB100
MSSRCLRALATAGILAGLFIATAAMADDQPLVAPPSPKFDIQAFKVEGNSLLPQNEVSKLVAPFTGKSRDFGDVQRALDALQNAYQKLGYNSVQVLLPEQELNQGVVRLRVVEQRIASLSVEGNQFYDKDNVLRALPSVKPGTLPNIKLVQKSLKIANENPSKQTAILFKDNDKDETAIDATVKVIDEKPWKAFLTLDNTGSRETGHSRVGFGYQNYNLFNRDHRITVQYITNLHFPDAYFNAEHRVNIIGGAYTIPFYEWGDSLDLIAGYSDVNTGTIASGAITVSGKGVVMGAHYNHNFAKIEDYEHKLTAAFDYHAYRSDVLNNGAGTGLTPHVSATPWSLIYAGLWQQENQQLSFSLGGSWNLFPDMIAHGGSNIYAGAPYLAEDDYSKYNFGFDYTHPFAKTWQYHLALNGQLTGDHLIPGEQFRIGGMDSVRGWHESVISGDKGYRFSIEAISPDFGNKISDKVGLRGVVFFDKGHVNNNHGVDGTPTATGSNKTIASVGAGLRYNYGKDIVARFDYAYVLDGDITKDNTGGSRERGDTFGHISLGWIW